MSVINMIANMFGETEITFEYLGFRLDCHQEEAHESTVSATENPIEGGSVSTDHTTVLPDIVTVRGFVVDEESFKYEQLKSLQKQRALAEVTTKIATYSNMILTSLMGIRNEEWKLELVMQFRELITVEVETVGGLVVQPPPPKKEESKPDGKKKAEKPSEQAATPKNKGKTQPKEQKSKTSVLKDIFG